MITVTYNQATEQYEVRGLIGGAVDRYNDRNTAKQAGLRHGRTQNTSVAYQGPRMTSPRTLWTPDHEPTFGTEMDSDEVFERAGHDPPERPGRARRFIRELGRTAREVGQTGAATARTIGDATERVGELAEQHSGDQRQARQRPQRRDTRTRRRVTDEDIDDFDPFGVRRERSEQQTDRRRRTDDDFDDIMEMF